MLDRSETVKFLPGGTFHERATSGFPLSIGTALAFESIFKPIQPVNDPNRQLPEPVKLENYDECWINLSTLYRNLLSSVKPEVWLHANTESIVSTLLNEIEIIQALFQNEGMNQVSPVFYHTSYDGYRKNPKIGVLLREPNTDQQKVYSQKFNDAFKKMLKLTDDILQYDQTINPPRKVRVLMITHQPHDLVNYNHFSHLDLLESHTGVLKPRVRWNTKYCPIANENLFHLPFNRKLLLVFGDRVLIQPMPIKFRKTVLESSFKRNWTPMTTLDKINMDLELDILSPYDLAVFRGL